MDQNSTSRMWFYLMGGLLLLLLSINVLIGDVFAMALWTR